MTARIWLVLSLAAASLVSSLTLSPAPACCPAPPSGKPVVNADQTVVIIWDAAAKTQHFIRQASFKSEADDFGFLVPTPAQPDLDESGDETFTYLRKLTEPETKKVARPSGGVSCGCSASRSIPSDAPPPVRVLQEKLVAGFNAVVLEASTANALVDWLKAHGYAFSPEVEAWAKPYVEAGWKITALKVAKNKDDKEQKTVAASSLRMSFKTDRPLFPYREPDFKNQTTTLGARDRLLRIYFLAEARYQGELTKDVGWTGQAVWAGKLKTEDKKQVLQMLKLPDTTGPAEWWLTEFEDNWPYKAAPADVYFSRNRVQNPVQRPPIIQYVSSPLPTDIWVYAVAVALVSPPLWRRVRRRGKK